MNRKKSSPLVLLVGVLVFSATFTLRANAAPPSADLPTNISFQNSARISAELTPDHQAYLKAMNTGYQDFFGSVVAIDGDIAVVGTFAEDSSGSGVNGTYDKDDFYNAGIVYIFVRDGDTWTLDAWLKASNPAEWDMFGYSVAVSGDTIVVGAYGEDSAASTVNGDQSDNSLDDAGAAYVFVRSGSTWTQQAYLKAANSGFGDNFGSSVAIDGDTIVVGATGEDGPTTGVNGDGSIDSAWGSGAAYVFTRVGTDWSQQAYLKATNTSNNSYFGDSVAISADTIVVSSPKESSPSTGVNGDETTVGENDYGSVYVFTRVGTDWSQQAYIKASNTNPYDRFGNSIDIDGDTLVVGANYEDSSVTGVNGDDSVNAAWESGAAYVFTRTGSIWSQQAYLKASNTEASDLLGTSVSVSGDLIAVSAIGESSSAIGVNGDQSNNLAGNSGAVYLYTREGSTWSQTSYIKASNTNQNDHFGGSVAFDGATLLVGATGESSSATSINGDQSNNDAGASGAAYVLLLSDPQSNDDPSHNQDDAVQITNISPRRGSIIGGTELTITGKNFLPDSDLRLNGVKMSCVYINASKFICNTPAGKFGPATLSISNDNGTDRSMGFEYDHSFTLPTTGFAPNQMQTLPIQPSTSRLFSTDLTINIPTIDVSTNIVGVPTTSNAWDVAWLGADVGYLSGSAFPTFDGNSVLTGHVWDADNTPGVFVDIRSLQRGDEIIIHAFGSSYTYHVTENLTIQTWDAPTVMKHIEGKSVLSLLTCENFDETTQRYQFYRLIRAELVHLR